MNCSDEGLSESDQPAIIKREKKMVEAMVQIYCESHHSTNGSLCSKCVNLKDYAKNRLDNCRYQEKKPVCGRCGLKCYNSKFRDYAEKMFMYSGPRMFFTTQFLDCNTSVTPSEITIN